jgi:hypothetical protein
MVSLTALKECVHSDGPFPPGRPFYLLMMEMHLEADIKLYSKMHSVAEIERVLDMHLEAMIV